MTSISSNTILVGLQDLYHINLNANGCTPPINLVALHNFTLYKKQPDPVKADQDSCEPPVKRQRGKLITVYIKTLCGEKSALELDMFSSVETLKLLVSDEKGIATDQFKLIFHGIELHDVFLISEYNILHNCNIHFVLNSGIYMLDKEGLFDSRYDFIYPSPGEDKRNFFRGNQYFHRPYGWEKKALNILGKYENDDWLGVGGRKSEVDSTQNEWPVSYHGTKREFMQSITSRGYIMRKGKRFVFGKGVYSTPDPNVAEEYAKSFTHGGKRYKMIFMNRLYMDYTKVVKSTDGSTYFVTSDDSQIRPYAILIKEVE